jgi:thiosulfate reductase cytochrome b subunit
VIPVMVISGLLYMFYRYPQGEGVAAINIESLEIIAVVHTFGAFLLIAFVIAHIYLTTTGHTPLSNLKAMLTGYEELEDEEEKEEKVKKEAEKEAEKEIQLETNN